jgi:hypothetical protein
VKAKIVSIEDDGTGYVKVIVTIFQDRTVNEQPWNELHLGECEISQGRTITKDVDNGYRL